MNRLNLFFVVIIFSISHFTTGVVQAESPVIELNVETAVLMALQNNSSLRIKKIDPALSEERLTDGKAVYDTELSGSTSISGSENASGTNSRRNKQSVQVSKRFDYGGDVSMGVSTDNSDSSSGDYYSSSFTISFSTPLLDGFGRDVTLSHIRQSEYDLESSLYALQAYAESLMEQVSNAYWDYVLAVKKIEIYEESYRLASEQLEETRARVKVGRLAEVEVVTSEAELASRYQSLIDIKSQTEILRLKLLRLINPGDAKNIWDTKIVTAESLPLPIVDVSDSMKYINLAMVERPDLKQANLSILKGNLEVVNTKNGLLPYLEFFVNMGNSGYARTFASSVSDIFNGSSDYSLGLNYRYTPGKRSERSKYTQSLLKKEQLVEAMRNMEMLAQEEVMSQIVEVKRTFSQLDASRATLLLQEEKLRAETEKYRVGKSTSINVAQAQRDLLKSKVDDVAAVYNCHKAIISLDNSTGVLSQRYGFNIEDTTSN